MTNHKITAVIVQEFDDGTNRECKAVLRDCDQHDEGKRQDSTHCAIGTKSECLAALWSWIDAVIAEQAAK